jgi:hypothetical protein
LLLRPGRDRRCTHRRNSENALLAESRHDQHSWLGHLFDCGAEAFAAQS